MELDKIPCFLCGEKIEVRNSKKGKPYFICDPCGLQAFIRRAKGIERLKEWMGGIGKAFNKQGGGEVLALVNQLEALEAKGRELEDNKGFFSDQENAFAESVLKREIKATKRQIRKKLRERVK